MRFSSDEIETIMDAVSLVCEKALKQGNQEEYEKQSSLLEAIKKEYEKQLKKEKLNKD